MATKKKMLDFILDQIETERDGYITYTKKYGKYVFTFNGEIFARIVDKTFYMLGTNAGRNFLRNPVKGTPYKNAEQHFIISEDEYSDSEWFSKLVDITIEEILPKKQKIRRHRRAVNEQPDEDFQ